MIMNNEVKEVFMSTVHTIQAWQSMNFLMYGWRDQSNKWYVTETEFVCLILSVVCEENQRHRNFFKVCYHKLMLTHHG